MFQWCIVWSCVSRDYSYPYFSWNQSYLAPCLVVLFAPDCVCMLLFAAFFHRGPHSSSPNHTAQRWLELYPQQIFQLFLCNAFFHHGKHLVHLENLVAWFIHAPENGNNSRRFPSRVTQLRRIATVPVGAAESHCCQCCWLSPHVPPCSLFFHSAGNLTVTSMVSQSFWNIPSILFQVVCLWLKLVDRRCLFISFFTFYFVSVIILDKTTAILW